MRISLLWISLLRFFKNFHIYSMYILLMQFFSGTKSHIRQEPSIVSQIVKVSVYWPTGPWFEFLQNFFFSLIIYNWPSPKVSTTPITAMGCQQCLSLSVVHLKGKHCRKPYCRNEVVDTFGPSTTVVLPVSYPLPTMVQRRGSIYNRRTSNLNSSKEYISNIFYSVDIMASGRQS